MILKTIYATGIVLALTNQLASAGSIADTYTAGDTLTVTTLDNIKSAVNDNDVRISNQLPHVTRLDYTASIIDSTITVTYELFRTVGVFTKQSAATVIELNWVSHFTKVSTLADDFCDFQLRIDDAQDASAGGRIIMYGLESAASSNTYFTGLTAGAHTVSIYVRGAAISCEENRGNFTGTVFVKEYATTSTSTFEVPLNQETILTTDGVVNGIPQ